LTQLLTKKSSFSGFRKEYRYQFTVGYQLDTAHFYELSFNIIILSDPEPEPELHYGFSRKFWLLVAPATQNCRERPEEKTEKKKKQLYSNRGK
jgi:hypothetical protein